MADLPQMDLPQALDALQVLARQYEVIARVQQAVGDVVVMQNLAREAEERVERASRQHAEYMAEANRERAAIRAAIEADQAKADGIVAQAKASAADILEKAQADADALRAATAAELADLRARTNTEVDQLILNAQTARAAAEESQRTVDMAHAEIAALQAEHERLTGAVAKAREAVASLMKG